MYINFEIEMGGQILYVLLRIYSVYIWVCKD